MLKTVIQPIKPFLNSVRGLLSSNNKNLYELGPSTSESLNIVFIVPAVDGHKAGGDKVIYKQSDVLNQIAYCNVTSQILHPDNHQFKHGWFEHEAKMRLTNELSRETDFVIIPEVMVIPHAKMLQTLGVRYGIYVQNGYSASIPLYVGSSDELARAYSQAEIIMTISDDTSECIRLAFPDVANKIQRIFYSVDSNKFRPSSNKENLITYMPRKLARHSDLVKFFLEHNLPNDWRLQPIHGLNEAGVIDLLAKSKIFLSFSEFEGCPLPPVEAALAGNYVIGYTGEGAREYWEEPIFSLVNCGDVKAFANQVLCAIEQMGSDNSSPELDVARSKLANRYSTEAELSSLKRMVERITNRSAS